MAERPSTKVRGTRTKKPHRKRRGGVVGAGMVNGRTAGHPIHYIYILSGGEGDGVRHREHLHFQEDGRIG